MHSAEEGGHLIRLGPFLLLCLAWIGPGLFGHDPWKADEPYTFGLIYHILQSGDWVVPTLAGEPFLEKPPLFFITAAGFAKLFSPLLPLHDAARLAGGFYSLLALFFTGLAGRELIGKGRGRTAALVLMGCVGLQPIAHKLITDTALLAGFSIAIYGLALSRRKWLPGGFWIGTGTGIGFMAKGLLAPGILGLTALLLPLVCRPWRNRGYLFSWIVALVVAVPWFVVWPYALYRNSPGLFEEWLWVQNLGRYLGRNNLGPNKRPGFYLYTLIWFALPAFPLALHTTVRERLWRIKDSPLWLPLTAFAVMFAVLGISSDARSLYAIPMLLPLSLLGAGCVNSLRGRAARWATLLVVGITAVAAICLWGGWLAMLTGFPVKVAERLLKVHPHSPLFQWGTFAVALAYTIAWVCIIIKYRRPAGRFVVFWASGMILVWGLFMTLWLAWLDAGRSYRSVIDDMMQAVPGHRCITSKGLGESERGMFHYHAGVVTKRVEVGNAIGCDLHLVQQRGAAVDDSPGPGWRKLWQGKRPGDEKERFVLWQRLEASRQ